MKNPTRADIRTFFNSDRAILMFCIGIALIFWLLVKLSQSYKTTKDYEISFTLPEGKTFVETPINIVKATLEGEGWDLISNYIKNRNDTVSFELAELPSQAFNSSAIIDKIQSNLPDNIDVNDVNTDFIFVQIENQAEKKVPLILNTDLAFATRFYMIDSISMLTDSILILGPRSLIDELENWQTETLVLRDVQKSGIHTIPLVKPKNSQIILGTNQIEIEFKVEEFTEKDVFVPIIVKNAPDSLKIFPQNIKLSFNVGLSNYNVINSSDFTVEVDLKDIPLNIEKNTIPVFITRQPSYIKNLNFNPKSVEFFFVETTAEEPPSN